MKKTERKKPLCISLSPRNIAWLKKQAKKSKVSASSLVEEMLDGKRKS